MTENRDLEQIAGQNSDSSPDSLEYIQSKSLCQRLVNATTNYLVDVSAAMMFYQPLMFTMEKVVARLEDEEILKTRLTSMAVNALTMRPYGLFREVWAKFWNADGKSHPIKKMLVDASLASTYTLTVYSTILYFSGVSLEEGLTAVSSAVAISAATGRPFGWWLDKWRKTWGKEPTLSK